MALDTRLTRDLKELDAIYRFRFQVYYGELGALLSDEIISTSQLKCPLDDIAYQYACFEHGRVVGCLRAVDLKDVHQDEELIAKYKLRDVIKEFGRDAIGFTGRLAVEEQFRKNSLVYRLMTRAADDARQRGIRLGFLDCSPHLLSLYEPFGCRRYAATYSDPVFGFKQPLLFMLRDKVGLTAIGSPLALKTSYEDDPEIRTWYERNYSEYASPRTASLLPGGAFSELTRCLLGRELSRLSLFRNLSSQEIDLVLKKSTVIHAKSGDVVTRPRLKEQFMFIVLSGRLETLQAGCRKDMLMPGDVYGETEFLADPSRTAEVAVREDAELLIMPTEYLAQLIEKEVTVGRTLMKNLAIGLAIRLQKASASEVLTSRIPQGLSPEIGSHKKRGTA